MINFKFSLNGEGAAATAAFFVRDGLRPVPLFFGNKKNGWYYWKTNP